MAFTHLHVHTEYSLLDGSCKIKELAKRAARMGMTSLAITDHGVMYGVIDFYRACLENGVKPIIGCEVYVAPGSRFDREPVAKDDAMGDARYFHLILLAENDIGYANLVKIVSKGFLDGFYYRPRVDLEVLREYHEGIICLSACLAGEVARYLQKDFYEEAKRTALTYQEIFGKGNYFLEMQDHGIAQQRKVNAGLMRLSQETGIELVATNDVHYINEDDVVPHDVLLCIQTGKKLSDENRMRYEGGQYYLKSEEEMKQLFPYAAEAVERTQQIADRCNVTIEFGVTKLPKFPLPEGVTSWEYLQKLCCEGLERRYPAERLQGVTYGELQRRLTYELETIRNMGYVDYFLIVWDFIHYAKEHDIMVGPGRGSAAGSIVAYCLEITDIDPIRYQLLFERFLNPERVSMPDIDVDFCFERRQEVIDYVVEKYGKDQVVQIVTFGTMAARGVIRDVGRVMDLPYALCDQIAKMVPNELNITINKALEVNSELKQLYEQDETVHQLIDLSKRLEGLPRHTSMHAAGVVISQKPVDEYVPLSRASDGSVTTQFVMTTLEELGLLKMDFLGLRTLTVIQNAVRLVEKNHGIHIDMNSIDMNDKAVFDMIGTGQCEGVFQLESAGMKSFMKELKPENLEDVIAGISLYRPGPMDFIPKYLKGKNERSSITYDCPRMEPILAPTYGCIVYQEQVMQIVRDLAGYSLGRSDLVRRAMSKKKASVMEKERKNFVYGNPEEGVKGCIANGISETVANQIYDEMTDFAKYAFNKSHAAAYAVVSYQTAYLKYYYPVEFMAALMTSVMDNTGKVSAYIQVCRKLGISILPPDINEGEGGFSVSVLPDGTKCIRYGLSAIKSVGVSVIDRIVEERDNQGTYRSLRDFAARMSGKEVNKRTVESFIKSGAMDSLPGTRKQKMLVFSGIMDDINRGRKDNVSGQWSLFDMMSGGTIGNSEVTEEGKFSGAAEDAFPDVGEYDSDTMLFFEKEVLGIYVSGHPLQADEALIHKCVTATSMDFTVASEEQEGPVVSETSNIYDGQTVVIGGMLVAKSIKTTKKNQMMAFITLEDLYGTVEVILFPKDYEEYRALLEPDQKLFVKGKVSMGDNEQGKVICQQIVLFSEVPREVWIQFEDRADYEAKQSLMYDALKPYDGKDAVVVYLKAERQYKKIPPNYSVHVCEELLTKLYEIFDSKNVKVRQKSIENM